MDPQEVRKTKTTIPMSTSFMHQNKIIKHFIIRYGVLKTWNYLSASKSFFQFSNMILDFRKFESSNETIRIYANRKLFSKCQLKTRKMLRK